MKELIGHNGAKIIINPASFALVRRLRQCIANELKNVSIDIGNPNSLNDLKQAFNSNVSKYLNQLKDLILGLETSQQFNDVIWECLSCCVYDNKQIKMSLFDDVEEARQDYDLIVYECLKENLAPFFSSLAGKLSALGTTSEKALE